MPISLRLDPQTERLVRRIAKKRRQSVSEVVRRGIRLVAAEDDESGGMTPFQAMEHLIGVVSGGADDLSERTGERFRAELAKRKSGR